MQKQINSVKEFHRAFKIGHSEIPTANLGESKHTLRYNLMKEENEEYLEACEQGNMIEIADALGDQLFVLLGTIVCHGMQDIIQDVFEEITGSNMSKLDANGNPIIKGQNGILEDDKPLGKILKSSNYYKPDLQKIFTKMENTNKSGINSAGGFVGGMDGEVKRAVTVVHTSEDEGKEFIDNFGRKYVYTKDGLIY